MKKIYFYLLLTGLLLPGQVILSQNSETQRTTVSKLNDSIPSADNDSVASLCFTGDIMTNPTIVEAFKGNDILHTLQPYLKGDIVFANLEFTVNRERPPLPYPTFNGSEDYLLYFTSYFNTFSIANNHAYDQGPKAENETVQLLRKKNILLLGGSTESPTIHPYFEEIKGVHFFFSAYTMVDNGLSKHTSDKGYNYFMNYYPTEHALVEKIKDDLQGVPRNTIKIISLHFGQEYKTIPEEYIKHTARALIDSGIDIIIGQHPHVPRPVEVYRGKQHNGIIMYSFGNFISFHKRRYNYLDISAIVNMKINRKHEVSFSFTPTYYAFFHHAGKLKFYITPIPFDPAVSCPPAPVGFTYNYYDKQALKKGYDLIHQFYAPLTTDSIRSIFTQP